MRKMICLLLSCLLMLGLSPSAYAAGITAAISTEPVTLNGVEIDNRWAKYPLLVYKDITYFPMTYYLCSFLGVSTRWDSSAGTLYINRTGENAEYTAETSRTQQKGRVTASRVEYPVVINGVTFDNENTNWPLISYNNVTYFPLTWALAVEELGWDYQWDENNGLRINSGNSGSSGSSGTNGGYDMTDGEVMNASSRRLSAAVFTVVPDDLTVDLWNDWSLAGIREAIRKELSDYVTENYDGSALSGGPSEIRISYSFQFPSQVWSGLELNVPFTAVFLGDTITLPSGKTFTPSANTTELTAIVCLSGQGDPTLDSAFQAGQTMYQRLKKCADIGTLPVKANTVFEASELIHSVITEKLYAAGLSEQYMIRALTLGEHVRVLNTGGSMTVDFNVTYAPLTDSAPTQDVDIQAQAVFQAK